MQNIIIDMCKKAFLIGKSLQLDNICYGPATFAKGGFSYNTSSYYYFLAGITKMLKFSHVIEVGTHYGGSTLSFYKGMEMIDDSKIVTIDNEYIKNDDLELNTNIIRIIGDGQSELIQQKAVNLLGCKNCDLIFIDALKDKKFVENVLNGFTEKVYLKLAILDDINLSSSMREMWKSMKEIYGDRALDISNEYSEIRDPKVGFGVIFLDENYFVEFFNGQ